MYLHQLETQNANLDTPLPSDLLQDDSCVNTSNNAATAQLTH
jgi:hypothetical protein